MAWTRYMRFKRSRRTKTILLTMHTESHYILQGVRAGAKGVVLKTHASEDLVRAIREASRGGTYMSSQVSSALVQAYQGKTELRPDPLSPRERQVQLIAEGKTTKRWLLSSRSASRLLKRTAPES